MRFACLAAILLAACSRGAEPGEELVGNYRGSDRDGLCIAREGEGLKAGLIVFGAGNMNCSLNGRAEMRGNSLIVTPRGDSECSVEIQFTKGVARLGLRTPSCTYYCGPGADYSGRVLHKMPIGPTKVTDFAGDPLC
jgi:hypothetical protein